MNFALIFYRKNKFKIFYDNILRLYFLTQSFIFETADFK